MTRVWMRHLIAPLCLVPFGIMLAVHQWLGLSDAMMIGPKPGERWWPLYNVAMIFAFAYGTLFYVAFSLVMAKESRFLLIAKLVALVAAWAIMMLVFWLSGKLSS